MCPLNGVLSVALLNALSWICLVFSYREASEPKLQNASLSIQGFLCILNETDTTKQAMWIYAAPVWEKQRSWLNGQTEIYQPCNLKRPSGRYSTYAFCFRADRIQKISLFLTPDMSIWRRPASCTILAVCKDIDWPGSQIGSTHHGWKCIFCHWDSRKLRETDMRLGEEEAKSDCFFPALETYDANIYAWGWDEFLGHPSTLSKNILMSKRRAHNSAEVWKRADVRILLYLHAFDEEQPTTCLS